MNRKYFISLICAGLTIALLLLFYCGEGDGMKVVSKIPKGFAPLHEFIEFNKRTDNILKMYFWAEHEPQQVYFCFGKAEKYNRNCFFYTDVSDSNYFVKYKGIDYFNETKYIKLVEVATHALEQRQRTYNLGDEVEVLGEGETVYKVKIISVKEIKIESCGNYSCATYHIKYAVTPDITESKQSLFASIETEGISIDIGDYEDYVVRSGSNIFDIVRSGGPSFIDKETVSVNIRTQKKIDKIEAIILRSPYYHALNYRIVVAENARR